MICLNVEKVSFSGAGPVIGAGIVASFGFCVCDLVIGPDGGVIFFHLLSLLQSLLYNVLVLALLTLF